MRDEFQLPAMRGGFDIQRARYVKLIKLPKYLGAIDATYWIRQVEHFFVCHGVPYEEQVVIATFHMDGHAQLWYKLLFDEEGELCWEEFCD